MAKFRTTNKKYLAAQIICSLVLGAYLVGGYSSPVAWGAAAAEQDASNVASYSVQWGEAIGTGVLAENNKELVTGGTVWAKTHAMDETLKLLSDATNELVALTAGFPEGKTIKETIDITAKAISDLETAETGKINALDLRMGAAADAIDASKDRIKALEDADFQGQIDDTQTYVNGEVAKLDEKVGAAADAIAASSDRIKALEDADFQGQIDDTQTYVNGEVAKLDEKTNANSQAINASKDRINGLDSRVTQNEKDIKTNADNIKELDGRVTQNENDIADLKASTSADLTAVNHRIDNLDSKINKVGAGAAALAALHPLDTDNKFTMAAGFGNYRNANAMALGMFYRPTDKVMFSVGGSMGNGENMINAGVSFALDKGVGTSKAAMARKIQSLEGTNAEQATEIQSLKAENAEQKAEIQELKEALARIEAKLAK